MTLDDIEKPCVGVDDNHCTSCRNIQILRNLDVLSLSTTALCIQTRRFVFDDPSRFNSTFS